MVLISPKRRKKKSTGPSSPSGEDRQLTDNGMMVPAFEEPMLTLDAGSIAAGLKNTWLAGTSINQNAERAKHPLPKLDDLC
jgi:peptidyl-prolyl cis-trans isomerase C